MRDNYTPPPFGVNLDNYQDVDWARLAYPQADQYDTKIIGQMAAERYGWEKKLPAAGDFTWADGQVRINQEFRPMTPNYTIFRGDHPRFQHANETLKEAWPEQFVQIQGLVNEVGAYEDHERPYPIFNCGCSCSPIREDGNPFLPHHLVTPDEWGNVCATHVSTEGWLEGIIHELAHWKGYALGMYIEDWEPILFENIPPKQEWMNNAPSPFGLSTEDHEFWIQREIGFQPLHPKKLRPIGAMFQEIWATVHYNDYFLRMLPIIDRDQGEDFVPMIDEYLQWVAFNVVRTHKSVVDLKRIAKPVPGRGEQFWHGWCTWYDDVYADLNQVWNLTDQWSDDEFQWEF